MEDTTQHRHFSRHVIHGWIRRFTAGLNEVVFVVFCSGPKTVCGREKRTHTSSVEQGFGLQPPLTRLFCVCLFVP